jgi:hypothetical protein
LADLAEARRIIIAHAQFETKEHVLHNFRLFRPPNYEVTTGMWLTSQRYSFFGQRRFQDPHLTRSLL